MGIIDPATTGPTGTKGGAKEGTGPVPRTFVIMVEVFQISNIIQKPSENLSNSNFVRASGVTPDKFAIINWANIVFFIMASPAEEPAATGIGIFGVGGCIGPGKVAKVGGNISVTM